MTAITERETGFCSGGDDDEGFYSHTDASDDSADLRVRAASQLRNKRKCSEPRRLDTELPAKKRKLDIRDTKTSPFRPWGETSPIRPSTPTPPPPCVPIKPWPVQKAAVCPINVPVNPVITNPAFVAARRIVHQEEPLSLVSRKKEPRRNPDKSDLVKRARSATSDNDFKMDSILSPVKERTCGRSDQSPKGRSSQQQIPQRNYKNMTRERRIEANARERTRVHTISAAFDTLRHTIPAYSHNQKLSKLSVLRIACSYIVTLSRLTGQDYSSEQNSPELSDCVAGVSRTIQTEGKVRKKKDE